MERQEREIRGAWIHLRLTPSEKLAVAKRAELENLTASAILRDGLTHILSQPLRGPSEIVGAGARAERARG